MIDEEKTFNINAVLQKLFLNVKETAKLQHAELIFEMAPTVPKDIRGDEEAFVRLMTVILSFALENMQHNEIVLKLNAPQDFFYEDHILFQINDSKPFRHQIIELMKNISHSDVEKLGVEISDNKEGNFEIGIPFKLHELGFRRHYRLSDKSMIEKNILVVCTSNNLATSLKEYFEYFHDHVDISDSSEGFDLTKYDILVTEDKSVTSEFKNRIIQAVQESRLKCVWIGEPHSMGDASELVLASLQKPITQESIWVLIEALFNQQVSNDVTVKNYTLGQNMVLNQELIEEIKQIENRLSDILNIEAGDKNSKESGLNFRDQLKRFLGVFERSDLYFRQLVHQNEYDKVETFCEDILKQSEYIGAESVHQLMEIVRLVLQHKAYDMLPVYPGKYHSELLKLKEKIKYFLKG